MSELQNILQKKAKSVLLKYVRIIQNQYSNAAIVKEINVLGDKLSISDPK